MRTLVLHGMVGIFVGTVAAAAVVHCMFHLQRPKSAVEIYHIHAFIRCCASPPETIRKYETSCGFITVAP